MNERNRVFGNNVKFLIVNGKFNEQTVAEHLGYSKYDLWKIMDGRLFLGEDEKADIARELQTTVEDLYLPRTEDEYLRFIGYVLRCTGIDSNELGH